MRIFILAAIISFPLGCFAQGTIDNNGRYIPPEGQVEANKRMGEALRNPDFIRLRLVFLNPHNDETTDVAPLYKSGDLITLRVILNHSFAGPIFFTDFINQYQDLRLELLRDGDVVPYNKDAQRYVERTQTEPPNGSTATLQLLPDKDYVLRRINFPEWYDTLVPGHYKLTVKRRFIWGAEWVQSQPITFEVGPSQF